MVDVVDSTAQQMQDAAGMPLDQTINDRVGGDLHVSTY